MTEQKPTYRPAARKELHPGINTVDLLALRADMARAILQAERMLEASGTPVESIIVTRRERRAHLTRRPRKRNI